MLESAERERRLKNLSGAVGTGLDEEIKRNKVSFNTNLCIFCWYVKPIIALYRRTLEIDETFHKL
jgi:hypothetical protein